MKESALAEAIVNRFKPDLRAADLRDENILKGGEKSKMKKIGFKLMALLSVLSIAVSAGCGEGQTSNSSGSETGGNSSTEHTHNYVNGYCTICGEKDPDYTGGGEIGDITGDDDFSYYNTTKLRGDKKVFVLNEEGGMSADTLNTVSALQGLFARKEVTFYVDGKYMTNGTNADMYYLDEATEKYGVASESITVEDAVGMYMDAWSEMVEAGTWGSGIDLASGFKDASGYYSAYSEEASDPAKAGYATPGFILYNPDTYSVNIASTLAGITGFLPVAADDKEEFEEYGLTEKMDVTNEMWSYKWCFDACMTELSSGGLVHQDYDLNGETNYYVRDYGVTYKYLYVYYDNTTTINNTLKKNIHSFLDKNIPIIGYAYNETQDVALFSQYGQFLVPTDYTMNLTFHVAEEFRSEDGFTQPNSDKDLPAESGKHYVAFVVSDGDNAQYWQNTAIFSTSYMNATGREQDDFAVTWSITPSLSDMMPLVMNAAYNGDITTENDYFCAPVSGQGYIDAGNFYNSGTEYMQDFLGKLDTYLRRADLSVTTIIGAENYKDGGIFGTMDAYASVGALKGGLVLNGGRYFEGAYSGGVYWKNGKPFIVPRDSLWSTTPAYIAARINKYASTETGTDVTTTDAYSVINVHPWSHNYSDIRTIVNMLSDNVEVVSLDRIVNMMTDSVTDKADTVDHFVMPESGSGATITDGELQQHPDWIPTDPLFNDFLLWEEDWTGDVTYRSSDVATSDVYPSFKTNIEIAAKGTAEKAEFTLPTVDNVWVSFYARANSTDPVATTSFRLKMTVGGEEKTVIEQATLRGVSGTETPIVTGDGWQAFAFPLKQYFPDYNGKQASFVLEVTGDISIKLDNFSITDRFIVEGEDTVCEDVYSNEFENGSTEDWMLGDQFQTSQYYHWAAYDRETLKPKGTLQVDASDGGGNEKRNGNTNVWFAKNVVLPETQDALKVSVEIAGGAKAKLSMYVDGKYVVVIDWTTSSQIKAKEVDISALCAAQGIESLSGKEVTFVFEVRDNANDDNGTGQDFNLSYFRIEWAGKDAE